MLNLLGPVWICWLKAADEHSVRGCKELSVVVSFGGLDKCSLIREGVQGMFAFKLSMILHYDVFVFESFLSCIGHQYT